MSDMTIDEATRDEAVGGNELVPVSDAGAPRSMSVAQIKDYVLAQIAALTAAGAASVSDDFVYLLRGGAMKPVSAAVLAAAIMDEAFGRAAVATPNGNEVIAVKDSAARKTLTLAAVKTWLEANMTVTPDLTLADAANAGTLGDSDVTLVVQAAAGKKVAIGTLKDYVLGKLAAFVTAQTAAQSVTTADVIYVVQGGVARKATVAQLMAGIGAGDVVAPASHVPGNIPAWDDAAKKLTSGFGVAGSISSTPSAEKIPTEAAVANALQGVGNVTKSGTPTGGNLVKWTNGGGIEDGPAIVTSVGATGADTKIPTEKAVRDAIAAASGVGAPALPVTGNIPQWGDGTALTAGKGVRESIRDTANASHDAIPTEKAVRNALDGLVQMPGSHTEDAIPQWGSGSELKPGKSVTTLIASASNASNDKIPTEKAVRDAIPEAATTATAGLMAAEDKQKLDNLVDTSAVPEIGDTGLADTDIVTVLKGGTTWMKALMTRFWTYIMGKLSTFKIDDLAAGEDNTDLDANTVRHGLCPKMSGDTTQFLRGDGAFATPEGSEAFTGDTGTGGTAGLVPAPAGGDAAANKFLNANGAWAVPPSAAGVDIPGSTAIDAADGADIIYCYDASANAYRKMTLAQVLALAAAKVRYDTIFIPAGAMIPGATAPATAGAVTFTNVKHDTMAFNATVSQTAEFDLALPDGWDGGAVKAKFLWMAYDATKAERGEAVKWQLGCTATADEGAITVAPTAWVDKTDTLSQVNELHRTTATAALTPEGTVETGGLLHFTVRRDNSEGAVSGAPLDTDALLLGVLIQYGKTENVAQW